MTPSTVFPFLIAGIACAAVVLAWRSRDRTPDADIGAVVFSDDVWVRIRRRRPVGVVRVRLLVGQEVIATRVGRLPHWLGKFVDMNHTVRAAAFEVGAAPNDKRIRLTPRASLRSSRYPHEWENALVLRGTDGRGWLELEFFRSRAASRGDVEQAFKGAGASSAAE